MKHTKPLTFDMLKILQEVQSSAFGGKRGVRDEKGLEAAVAVQATIVSGDLKDLSSDTLLAVAAQLTRSILKTRPFYSNNKRVAYHAMATFLAMNGRTLTSRRNAAQMFLELTEETRLKKNPQHNGFYVEEASDSVFEEKASV